MTIAVLFVVFLILGDWLRAFDNALWLFVAWMYWKQMCASSVLMKLFIDLQTYCKRLTEINEILIDKLEGNGKEKLNESFDRCVTHLARLHGMKVYEVREELREWLSSINCCNGS